MRSSPLRGCGERFPRHTQVEFRSKKFPELPGEAEENVNGLIGKGFCQWVRHELPKFGQGRRDEIVAEDFGWLCFLECEYPLWIGATHQGEDQEGMASYSAIVVAEFPRRWFRKRPDPTPFLEAAAAAFRRLIESEAEIRDVRWFIDD